MNRIKDILFLVIFIGVLLVALLSFIDVKDNNQSGSQLLKDKIAEKQSIIRIKDMEFSSIVADTINEQRTGLSGKESLPSGTVMLFVFPESTEVGIWMKDMHFPIDIIWVDEEFRIIHIVQNVQPETFPEVFKPSTPARYVIEANAGFVSQNDITLGDFVNIVEE